MKIRGTNKTHTSHLNGKSGRRLSGLGTVLLDQKARFAVPAKFRRALRGEKVILMVEGKGRGALIPEGTWNEIFANIEEAAKRFFCACSYEVRIDVSGRILIPKAALEVSDFVKGQRLVISGQGRYIRIWSMKTWEEDKKKPL